MNAKRNKKTFGKPLLKQLHILGLQNCPKLNWTCNKKLDKFSKTYATYFKF